jgi:diacylglycerol O-acyltransferase / wax synthase
VAVIARLSAADLTNLVLESPESRMHQAALGVLDGAALVDASGRVRLDEVQAHFESRLARVPELRSVLWKPGLLGGRPIWVDYPGFEIADHVHVARLDEPGERGALAFAERQMPVQMDRSKPLWQVWFLEGFAPGQVGLLIKLHHALADGPAMINLVAQVFDLEPAPFERPAEVWQAAPPPAARELIRDNLRRRLTSLLRLPSNLRARDLRGAMAAMREGRRAPRTSLNAPIGATRRLESIPIPFDDVRSIAHAHGVKINDVFLCIVAGALRQVLLRRGEPTDDVRLHASVAVSLHDAGDVSTTGNRVAEMVVPIDVGRLDPELRLAMVAAAAGRAKKVQRAVLTQDLLYLAARTGLAKVYIERQHMINVLTTNLPGPPVALYFAGARLLGAAAIPPIAGNVTVSFAALSYAGRLTVTVVADARAWPDLDVLVEGLRSTWNELAGTKVLARDGPTALSA